MSSVKNAVEQAVREALEMSPTDRRPFLSERLGTAEFHEAVRLLGEYEEASRFFNDLAQAARDLPADESSGDGSVQHVDGMIDKQISHFRVIGRLGGGGMGIVYKARDVNLQRHVAIKVLPPELSRDPDAMRRFRREAMAASQLDHPNIAVVHEIGSTDEGRLFIAMAFYSGSTLKQRLASGRLSVEEARSTATAVALGLEAAHNRGIIHRDIKPANIILTDDGAVKIVDFGLAKMASESLTRTGSTVGTISYMSPEQARGEPVDHRTDIWSLGVVMFEMLTGVRPFAGHFPEAIIYSLLNEDPPDVRSLAPKVPPDVADLVKRCLEKEAADRPRSVRDVVEVMSARSEAKPSRPHVVKVVGVGMILVVLLAAGIFGAGQGWFGKAETSPFAGGNVSVAILPPASESGESDELLAGLFDTAISSLVSRSSLRGPRILPLSELGSRGVSSTDDVFRLLGLSYVITASQTLSDASTRRIRLSLVGLPENTEIESLTIDAPVEDLPALQREVENALATLLRVGPPLDRAPLPTAPGTDQFYAQARGLLLDRGDPTSINTAIALFGRVIEVDPAYAPAYVGIGRALLLRYELEQDPELLVEARQMCEAAARLDARSSEIQVVLGEIHNATGQPGIAIAFFDNALERDSLNVDALTGLASSYQKLGREDEAVATFRRAIDLRRDYWGGYSRLAYLYFSNQEYATAADYYRSAVDLAPRNPQGYANLGAMYFFLEMPDSAEAVFRRGIERAPNYGLASNFASYNFHEGDYEEAARYFEQALDLNDKDYVVWGYLAAAYRWLDGRQSDRSSRALENAVSRAADRLEADPSDKTVQARMADYYAELGRREEAAKILRVLSGTDLTPEQMFLVGEANELLGNREEAVEWIRRAVEDGFSTVMIRNSPYLEDLKKEPSIAELLEDG